MDIDNWKVAPQDQKPVLSDAHHAAVQVLRSLYSQRLYELAAKERWTDSEGWEIQHLTHLFRILENYR